jgi:hypothetical protein
VPAVLSSANGIEMPPGRRNPSPVNTDYDLCGPCWKGLQSFMGGAPLLVEPPAEPEGSKVTFPIVRGRGIYGSLGS